MVMKSETKGKLLVTSMVLGAATMHMTPHAEATSYSPEQLSNDPTLQLEQLLSFGDTGQQVFHLQGYLLAFQYYKGAHDGMYGLLTYQAVKHYQESHDLKVDGQAGPKTISHMLNSAETVLGNGPYLKANIKEEVNDPKLALVSSEAKTEVKKELHEDLLLRNGDQGQMVMDLQEHLKEYGYYQGVDGIFGNQTKQAVMNYQRAHDLLVDGIAGSETIGHILSEDEKIEYDDYKATVQTSTQEAVSTATEDVTASSESQPDPEPEPEPKPEPEPEPKADGASSSIISTAKNLIGSPYVWGGTSPSGFDCSGFLLYVYKQHGVTIPRTVSQIWGASSSVSNPSVGDIVFFTTYAAGPSHAGIYLGNGDFIHAGSSTGVTISNLDQSYWSSRYLGAKRIN
nr:peptidoglycan-binding protein [Bacillus alkalicellulosilyticus]